MSNDAVGSGTGGEGALSVALETVAASGHQIAGQAMEAEHLSGSLSTVETGDEVVDAAVAGLVGSWAVQLSLLAAVTRSLGSTMGAAVSSYRSTETSIAGGFA